MTTNINTQVDLSGNNDGQCQVWASLDTLYTGQVVASGIMFSVKAKQPQIELLSLEFANFPAEGDLKIKVYTRPGNDYLTVTNQPDAWTLIADTVGVPALNGIGMMAPRADFTQSVPLVQNEYQSFFLTCESQHLQLLESDAFDVFVEDDALQLNVGVSTRLASFSEETDGQRAFQGKLHYRTIQACSNLSMSTKLENVRFGLAQGTDARLVNTALTNGMVEIMETVPKLSLWSENHDLQIESVQFTDRGNQDDCQEHGFAEGQGCAVIDGTFSFRHYQSLTRKELELELISTFVQRNGTGLTELKVVTNGVSETLPDLVYMGEDKVLQQGYIMTLTGVPENTIFNPVQRDYVSDVTFDFLNQYASNADSIYLVKTDAKINADAAEGEEKQDEQEQQQQQPSRHAFLRRTLEFHDDIYMNDYEQQGLSFLRRRDGDNGNYHDTSSMSRQLRATGVVQLEASIYGIGSDMDAFREGIEDAFSANQDKFRDSLVKTQYLPGEINEDQDLGIVFSELYQASVKRGATNTTVTSDGGKGLTSSQYQIIGFSFGIALSAIWLGWMVYKDYFAVESGAEIKKEETQKLTMSEKHADALKFMDDGPKEIKKEKPKRHSFDDDECLIGLNDVDDFDDEPQSLRRGRKPPTARGVGRAKSSEDAGLGGPSSFTHTPRGRPAPASRGIGISRSADASSMFGSTHRPASASSGRPEPTRGVGRSKSADLSAMRTAAKNMGLSNVNSGGGAPTRGREAPATRGVRVTQSADDLDFFASSGHGKPPLQPLKKRGSSHDIDLGFGKEEKKDKKKKGKSSKKLVDDSVRSRSTVGSTDSTKSMTKKKKKNGTAMVDDSGRSSASRTTVTSTTSHSSGGNDPLNKKKKPKKKKSRIDRVSMAGPGSSDDL